MKTSQQPYRAWLRCIQRLLWIVTLLHRATPALPATLADFGHSRMLVDGLPNAGTRSLVVILVNFPGDIPLPATSRPFFDSLIFDSFGTNGTNIVDFFLTNSSGRFTYSRGGLIGPLGLTEGERLRIDHDLAYQSNIVAQAMIRGRVDGFEFGDFDRNHDNIVSDGELEILIVSNDRYPFGDPIGHRPLGCVQPPGFSYRVCGWVAHVLHNTDFATIAHELAHGLNESPKLPDLYSRDEACHSRNLTLMSCTGPGSTIVHLDPWLKMQLGWAKPRIYSISSGGLARLPAAQLGETDAPIILYDPIAGVDEFFMLEYRARALGNYDWNVPDDGMALWHIKQDASHNQVAVPALTVPTEPSEGQWWYCQKCGGMHQGISPNFGSCPASGVHTNSSSKAYLMIRDSSTAPGQNNWRRCRKCQGLFFYGRLMETDRSVCPSDNTAHDATGSGIYTLVHNEPDSPAEIGWRRCFKCQALFAGGEMAGVCPADNAAHANGPGYGIYSLYYNASDQAVWTEGAPDLRRGGSELWGSGSITPSLKWIDRREMPLKVFVRPFNPGDRSIHVEWIYNLDLWVDFNYPGGLIFPEFGTFENPFNTVVEGLGATPWGGHLNFKPGHRAESARFDRRMTVWAPFGPVTIGR